MTVALQSIVLLAENRDSIFLNCLHKFIDTESKYDLAVCDIEGIQNFENTNNALLLIICSPKVELLLKNNFYKEIKQFEKLLLIVDIAVYSIKVKDLLHRFRLGIIGLNSGMEQLLNCIDDLFTKDILYFFAPDITNLILSQIIYPTYDALDWNPIEEKIAKCYKLGMNIDATAVELNLSKNTVASYRSKMIKKAGVKSMNELISKFKDRFWI